MWPWKQQQQLKRDTRSVLGKGVHVTGRIDAVGDLTILGSVEGDICHQGHLVIAAGAKCLSNIQADSMQVAGEVHGNLHVRETLELLSTARLFGDTVCASLQVQQGAAFFGTNHMAGSAGAAAVQPLALLLEPVGVEEREVLGVCQPAPEPEEPSGRDESSVQKSPAFYGGFSAVPR